MDLEKTYNKLIKERDAYRKKKNSEAVKVIEGEIDKLRLIMLCEANQLTTDDLFKEETENFKKMNFNQ